jgi:hypothetical protein
MATNRVVSIVKQTDRYTGPATLGVTIVPSGSTTTRNCFNGLGVADCSAHSLAMERSSLTIPERVHPSDTMRFLIFGLAKRMAATITDIRIKAILYKFVRLTMQIRCIIARPALSDSATRTDSQQISDSSSSLLIIADHLSRLEIRPIHF